MSNQVLFYSDEEHRSLSVVPENNSIIKKVSLVYYEPDLVMPMHVHDVGQFSTLLTGQAVEQNLSAEFETYHGLAEFKPVAYRHSNKIGPQGAIFLSVNIDSEHDDFLSEYGHLDWGLSDTKSARTQWQRVVATLLSDNDIETVDFEERIVSLLDLSVSSRIVIKRAPHWLQVAEQAVSETQMSVAEIADYVGVHRVHLSRTFQSHFGLSVSQFRLRAMSQRSLVGMFSENENIASASIDSGFADQSHFTRTLKQQFGTTPHRMRHLFLQDCA